MIDEVYQLKNPLKKRLALSVKQQKSYFSGKIYISFCSRWKEKLFLTGSKSDIIIGS